jgi:16S rRNA (uracil1498-N3)-methyltransferase
VNLVLFEPHELGVPLPAADRRVKHVLEVLRREVGGTFDAGVVNGPRGKATVTALTPEAATFAFAPTTAASAPAAITLIVGLPRPQTARDILRDATTVGVAAIDFVRTDKAEASYAQSTLWTSGEWRRHAVAGAEQAFDTRVPEVTYGQPLETILERVRRNRAPDAELVQVALDNYESGEPLTAVPVSPRSHVVLAIGAERGWSTRERTLLRNEGFQLVHLGSRVLRTETAVVAALTLVHARLSHV